MILPYDRIKAVQYAKRWALDRNPRYYDFSNIGGDCTNFASQCLFNGALIMDYTPTFGWYYVTAQNRTPSWTGVDYFCEYLLRTTATNGPFATLVQQTNLMLGDFIQLSNNISDHHHTLVVCDIVDSIPVVCAHSDDSYMRPLTTYQYTTVRCLHILGVRVN